MSREVDVRASQVSYVRCNCPRYIALGVYGPRFLGLTMVAYLFDFISSDRYFFLYRAVIWLLVYRLAGFVGREGFLVLCGIGRDVGTNDVLAFI